MRPLLTYDKNEITDLAKKFRIDDVVNIPSAKSCLLLPPNPATLSTEEKIKNIENELRIYEFLDKLIEQEYSLEYNLQFQTSIR